MGKINIDELLAMKKEGISQVDIAKHFGVSPAAVSKRWKRIKPLPDSLNQLSEKEQRFAVEVANGKTQTQAALASFECSSMDSAKNIGTQLMKKPDIQVAVADLMQEEGLTRRYRVQKLKKHVDAVDPNVSLKALDQSWKLEGAYTEKHVHVHATYEELEEEYADLVRQRKALEAELGIKSEDLLEAEFKEL